MTYPTATLQHCAPTGTGSGVTVFDVPTAHVSVALQVTGSPRSAHKRHQQHRPEALRMSSSPLTISCRIDDRAYFVFNSEREHKKPSACASFLRVSHALQAPFSSLFSSSFLSS